MPELRSRVIPPDFWLNYNLGSLGDSERLLFQFLVQYADDFGRFEFDPHLMRGMFWMFQPERTVSELIDLFNTIVQRCKYLGFYEANGHNYYAFNNWADYQTLRHPKKSGIPAPEVTESFRIFPKLTETFGKIPKTPAHIVTVLDSVSVVGTVVVSESTSCTNPEMSKAKRNAAELEAAFDEFWKIYPRKTGPTVARRVWRREIKLAFVPDVIQAALRYADLRKGEPEQYTKLASTWLNKGVWRDSLTDEAPKPGTNGNGFETRSERNVRNLKAIQEQFGLGQVFDFRGGSDEGGHLLGPGDSDAGRNLGDRPGVDGSHKREDNPDEPTQ